MAWLRSVTRSLLEAIRSVLRKWVSKKIWSELFYAIIHRVNFVPTTRLAGHQELDEGFDLDANAEDVGLEKSYPATHESDEIDQNQ